MSKCCDLRPSYNSSISTDVDRALYSRTCTTCALCLMHDHLVRPYLVLKDERHATVFTVTPVFLTHTCPCFMIAVR